MFLDMKLKAVHGKMLGLHMSLILFTLLTIPHFHSLARGRAGSHTIPQNKTSGPVFLVFGFWLRCRLREMPKLTLISTVETLSPLCDPLAGNVTALHPGNVPVCTTVGAGDDLI